MSESDGATHEVAALNTRSAKAEPQLPELLKKFEADAKLLGITSQSVAAMWSSTPTPEPEFSIDHEAVLNDLIASQSCATAQEALTNAHSK
jgi:hypothetical protein